MRGTGRSGGVRVWVEGKKKDSKMGLGPWRVSCVTKSQGRRWPGGWDVGSGVRFGVKFNTPPHPEGKFLGTL